MAGRGADGRFIRTTGSPIPADGSGPPTVAVIVPQLDDPAVTEWGVRQVSAGFAVDLDAGVLVDAMTRGFMDHVRRSLMTGQRPDGKGEQKALSPRALADPDRESPHRGFNSGELADGIRRTAIKSTGPRASSTCYPPTSRTAYVASEQRRGVVLLTGAGAAGEAAASAAREAAAAMMSGEQVITTAAEVTARDAVK